MEIAAVDVTICIIIAISRIISLIRGFIKEAMSLVIWLAAFFVAMSFKEVFAELEYTDKVQKVTTKGKENIKEEMLFKDRISTHTARRTFITMMKRLTNTSLKIFHLDL